MPDPTHPFVTIVSGAPRSGTSMMMRMLDEGGLPPLTDGVRTADSDNPRGYYEFEPVKKTREDASWLERAPGHAVKMVYVLLRDLPPDREYRVLLMRRDPAEMVASQLKMLERLGRPAGNLSPERRAQMQSVKLDETETWLDGQAHFTWRRVDYNRLVGSKKLREDVTEIASFVGGALDVDAMAAVIDPSLYRNRNAADEPRS